MGFIATQKEKFIRRKTVQLREQKEREGRLVKANAEYQKERRDVDAIKQYNNKVEATRPNLVRNVGQGLAKMLNEKKKQEIKPVAKVSKKGLQRMAQDNQGSKGLNVSVNSEAYTPSGRFDFGGNSGSPFNQTPQQDKKKKGPFDL